MIYKLFYAPDSAALGPRVLLEEIGADYELIDTTIEQGKPRDPDHLALNPNGWVPVLTWEGGSMYEASAIAIYLTDLYPQAQLGPAPSDPERAVFLQTLVYFSNTVQTAFQQHYYPHRFAADAVDAKGRAANRLRAVWQIVDDQLAGRDWVVGNRFSAADVHLLMLSTWFEPEAGHPTVADFPNVARVAAKVAKRPSVIKVFDL
ncbi:MAG: glutathione S-transferase family protein [Pseudomonadota bacterium]